MRVFGVDVSRHNGPFDFARAKAEGAMYVILKGGGGDDGDYTDAKFADNYSAAKAAGLNVGAYWFSKALTVAAAISEADYFYNNCLSGRKFELPIYIDVENKAQLSIGRRALTDVIKAFCDRLESRGYWVGIYSSKSYFDTYVYDNELAPRYAHWVAQWSDSCTYGNAGCFGVWQFGGETNKLRSNEVAGVVCDQDYMLIDYPALIKAKGCNGYAPPAATGCHRLPPKNTVLSWQQAAIADGYSFPRFGADGAWGKECQAAAAKALIKRGSNHQHLNCVLQQLLGVTDDGIIGDKTVAVIKSYQSRHGLAADGIVGPVTWAKLLGV